MGEISRVPDIDDATWAEVKQYVEGNPETAKSLQKFAKNPEAMRGWLQTQAIAEHYNTKLSNGDAPMQERMKSLESDPEFLGRKKPLDGQDHKGITALGYAIGANKIAVVKLLLDNRANPFAVDSSGNSGLHYAAGYGR